MDLHGAGQGGRVGGGDEVIPAVVHPFPVVYPVPVAACAVIRALGTLAAVFPVALPFPVGVPLCAPEAPGCGGFLGVGRQRGKGKMRVGVRSQRIGRQVLLKGDDLCDEAGLCRGCTADGYLYGKGGGFQGRMPFCPDHLGAACRHYDVVYRIGAAVDSRSSNSDSKFPAF